MLRLYLEQQDYKISVLFIVCFNDEGFKSGECFTTENQDLYLGWIELYLYPVHYGMDNPYTYSVQWKS